LYTITVLEVSQVLAPMSNESSVLSGRNVHSQNDTIAKSCNGLLQFSLDLTDKFRIPAEAYLIRWFTLMRAAKESI
jgi:hypothetical protein